MRVDQKTSEVASVRAMINAARDPGNSGQCASLKAREQDQPAYKRLAINRMKSSKNGVKTLR